MYRVIHDFIPHSYNMELALLPRGKNSSAKTKPTQKNTYAQSYSICLAPTIIAHPSPCVKSPFTKKAKICSTFLCKTA